jgi:hypothetical protein
MTAYHLCQQSDGRIVLDREVTGEVVQTIEVDDPPLEWGWSRDGEQWMLVQRPAYHVAYDMARARVSERGLRHIHGEGWFRGS